MSFATHFCLSPLAAHAVATAPAQAQNSTKAKAAAAQTADTTTAPDRGSAYYHYGLAKMYEDMAGANGRQDYATQAIEEYKLALDRGPRLADAAERPRRPLLPARPHPLKQSPLRRSRSPLHPDDVQAHQLLGRVYLRSLGDMQGPQSGEMLQLAIKEYETIARLKPNDLETHLLLGQLYGL